MSATNRGSVRVEQDCYPTPLTALAPLLPYLPTGDLGFIAANAASEALN